MTNRTRRDFLQTSILGAAAAVASCHRSYGQVGAVRGSANGDIRVAVVGLRTKGLEHMLEYAGRLKGARLVALCDCDREILAARQAECGKLGVTPAVFRDYRKLLESRDVDAVVLAPPNHHHSLMTIWALKAGKDVYVEKPLSHNIWEGRQAVAAARKYPKNVVQAGMQNRSSDDIKEAIAYVRSGQLGRIQWVRGLCYKQRDSIGRTTGPQPVPAAIDYDLWTGPADLTPPRRNSPKNGTVHYDWHWFWNYGGGDICNQGVHQLDIARWFLDEPGLPPSVISFGGRFGYRDDAETPNTLVTAFDYPRAPLIFEVRGLPAKAGMQAMDAYRGTRIGVIVQCEGGYVAVSETGTAVIYDRQHKILRKLAESTLVTHYANFVRGMQTRQVFTGLIEDCHLSTSLCHLANISYLLGAGTSPGALAEAIRADASSREACERMLDHLRANGIPAGEPTVLGPRLPIDAASGRVVGPDPTIRAAANACPIMRRTGRGAFAIPVIDDRPVAAG
ncbi:MAG: Gfo/Idh/MocA family oxidoreductase [Verrucomicrobia bacterium]|nr:Gfo/Idh/MocA family oxidoreductase [Verrucomicrobiota bacterium]